MKKTFLKASSAFTLIELLIVVAIIGILVGIGVPALRDARTKAVAAKKATVEAQVATAKTRVILEIGDTAFDAMADDDARFTAIHEYMLVNGVPPATKAAMLTGLGTSATLAVGNSATPPAVSGAGF